MCGYIGINVETDLYNVYCTDVPTSQIVYSPEFKAQMEVRNVAQYTEPASTVAVAVEKDCIAVYGDPIVDDRLVRCFGIRMIRISQLEQLMK